MLRHLLKRIRVDIDRIAIAGTLSDALAQIRGTGFDLILLDLNLPDSNGLGTFTALHKAAPDLPIIIVTSMDDESLALVALKHGAQDYVFKNDVNAKTLQKTILYAMERIQRQKLEAEKVSLYEQREDLIATIIGDLKIPLTDWDRILDALSGKDVDSLNSQQKTLVNQLKDQHHALLSLIDKLIDTYSYDKEPGSMTSVDVVGIMHEQMSILKPVIDSKNIQLESLIPASAPPIIANRASMLLLIKHLLEGAVTFSPPNGSMKVRLAFAEFVDIEITDSGPQLQDVDQAKLFQRFKRARLGKRDTHGFGLALHLCKRIVDSHGGMITVRSQPNSTTFAVRLPISRTVAKQPQEEEQLQG